LTELKEIEEILSTYNLLDDATRMEIDQRTDNQPLPRPAITEVALLPFYDYMAVSMETDLLTSFHDRRRPYSDREIQKWIDFAIEKSTLNAGDLAVWCDVNNQVNQSEAIYHPPIDINIH